MHAFKLMALSMLTLAVGLAADHPITISGGSPLTIEHDSWDPNPPDDQHRGSTFRDYVTRVVIASDSGAIAPIEFKKERLELELTYGTIQLNVVTGRNGQDPVVTVDPKTSFTKHFHPDGNKVVSNVDGPPVQGLTVKKAGNPQTLLPAPSGHTVIVICYGPPDGSSLPECQAR